MRYKAVSVAAVLAVQAGVGAASLAGCAVGQPTSRFAVPATVPDGDTTVSIAVEIAPAPVRNSKERGAQYVGGSSTTGSYNDVATLVIGLFDAGTTVAPSFGFKYASVWGGAVSSSSVAGISGSTWLADLQARMATTTSAGTAEARRYLVREYTSGLGSATGLAASFSKIPRGGSAHTYVAFAAAYDADGSNLGFATGYVEPGFTATDSNSVAARLTLTLNTNLYTGTLMQEVTIANVYPEAL